MEQLSFYRTKSAFQLDLIPAEAKGYTSKKGTKGVSIEKTGSIIINAANGENRTYNWDDKIVFAIGIADIPILLSGFVEYERKQAEANFLKSFNAMKKEPADPKTLELKDWKVDLVHDPGAGTDKAKETIKTLSFVKGNLDKKGNPTFFLSLQTNQNQKVSVALSEGEFHLLFELFKSAYVHMLGWPQKATIQE
jgi:hypothetical protein